MTIKRRRLETHQNPDLTLVLKDKNKFFEDSRLIKFLENTGIRSKTELRFLTLILLDHSCRTLARHN
jgi:hypothetical protein